MTSSIIELTKRITELPAPQRETLIPLFASLLSTRGPKPATLPPSLAAALEELVGQLGPDPSQWGSQLEAMMQAKGITAGLLRELSVEARSPAQSPELRGMGGTEDRRLEARAAPGPGQVRAGPTSRFELERRR